MRVLLGLIAVLVLSGAFAFAVVPLLGRRLWKPDPLMAKRLRRFRGMPAGFGAFVLIVSALVASQFLELYCNSRPLYIRYKEHVQYPAVADWASYVLPFKSFNSEVHAGDFGLSQQGTLDAREYSRWVHDPAQLEQRANDLESGVAEDEQRFRSQLAEDAKKHGLAYDPQSPLPAWKVAEQKTKLKQAQDFRALEADLKAGAASIVMPLYPYSPQEQLLSLPGYPPHPPFQPGLPILGTDSEGRDVLSTLLYGFRVNVWFGLIVAFVGYAIGIFLGGAMGYYGGWFDIIAQRLIEIWASIPFLYTIMIIASIVHPSFLSLALINIVFSGWIGITYYMRGEFYREKARDYVQAARALGLNDAKIMRRHILPNALVPVVTFLPFDVVGYMSTLVALDFLGFGLPPGTPSWGVLLEQGAENIVNYPHLVYIPVIAFAGTLFCVVLIGEAVREAFDPKKFARLK